MGRHESDLIAHLLSGQVSVALVAFSFLPSARPHSYTYRSPFSTPPLGLSWHRQARPRSRHFSPSESAREAMMQAAGNCRSGVNHPLHLLVSSLLQNNMASGALAKLKSPPNLLRAHGEGPGEEHLRRNGGLEGFSTALAHGIAAGEAPPLRSRCCGCSRCDF